MRYSFEFKKDKFGDLEILLPEKISIFSDFIQNISTVEELDEYIGYIQNVIDGVYENFEITLNATSVNIKKDETVAEHHYRIEEPFENKIETKEFIELLLIWREEIPDILQKDFILENGTEFEEHLEYGGPYELAIVEYTPDGNEKLFTGLAYDKYENGNIESYFYVEQGVKQGKCVEFYSNGNVKKLVIGIKVLQMDIKSSF